MPALAETTDFAAQVQGLRKILEAEPGRTDVSHRLAALLFQLGDLQGAVDTLHAALVIDPGSAATAINLGVVLKSAGLLEQAADVLRHAVSVDPGEAAGHYNLAGALEASSRVEEAESACRAALALRPDWAEAHNRLGSLLHRQGRLDEARQTFQSAADLQPAWFLPHHNLGQVAMQERDPRRAIAHFRESIRREPSFAQSHLDMGALLLQTGDLEEGWRELEWRFNRGGATPQRPGYDAPVWDGSPLDGRVVMVWIEQGLGDHIQFCRYVREIRERGGRVWLQAPRPLLRLYGSLDGVERLVAPGEEPAGFDFQAPILSLARLCGTDATDRIPAGVPYLAAPDCGVPVCVEAERGFRVGIVWASAPGNPAAGRRDCPVSHFARLAGVPGVSVFSLQLGERPDLEGVRDLSDRLGDFATTAAIVERMDLVITVDTAMAHLAGALGKKVWTLLSEPADWRWLLDREDSPWYPTMRLFRQPAPGDWDAVFDRVESALRNELATARGR
jgi:Tfp pilus assembly protein PilF